MMARLEEICAINMGQSPDSSTYNEDGNGLPFFQGNADFGEIYPAVRMWCSEPTKIAREKDILISVRAPIGALNIANCECCIGRGLAALAVNEDICAQEYLWHALSGKVDELNSKGTGSTFKAINKKTLSETEIPLPPIDEQRKIAAVLDKVSDLIAKRQQQLDKLDEAVKARFVEIFGEPDENPKHWQEDELSHHLKVIGGYAFKSDGFTDEGIPVLRIGNINSGHFLPVNMVYWPDDLALARYKVFPGDLVMSLTGTVGKDDYGNVCILGADYDEYYLNQRNAKLSIEKSLNKCYFSELLKFPRIKKRLTGISRGIRQANISNIIDFDQRKKYERAFDISGKASVSIGNNKECDIYISSEYISGDSIVITRNKGLFILSVNQTSYGVYINGSRAKTGDALRNGDFLSISDFFFYLKNDRLWAEIRADMSVKGLAYMDYPECNHYPKFTRNARVKIVPSNDTIEILDPPELPEKPKGSIFMRLLPSLGMMVSAAVMAMLGSITMIIFSGISGVMSIVTAVITLKAGNKEYNQSVASREKKYTSYDNVSACDGN